MDTAHIRTLAAVAILGLSALIVAVIVLIDTLRGSALPGYVETVAGFLIGFATHELGVTRGQTTTTTPPMGM